jgi:hypothetical protein
MRLRATLRRIGTPFFLAFAKKAKKKNRRKLSLAVSLYGKYSTQKTFQKMLATCRSTPFQPK